jgi:hypothetical protein
MQKKRGVQSKRGSFNKNDSEKKSKSQRGLVRKFLRDKSTTSVADKKRLILGLSTGLGQSAIGTLGVLPESGKNGKQHPVLTQKLTLGQRAADMISQFGGSWTFIIIFFLVLGLWVALNSWFLLKKPFDPFPFILLNLTLSCLAAVQAPIILMAQNRQAERDRLDAKYDHAVNRKAEREIQAIQKDLLSIRGMLKRMNKK